MSSATCHHCGSSEIDVDAGRGDAVCTNCGSVLEDNIIVSEVQFEETARGSTSAVGQFVSSDGKVPLLGTGFHHGIGKESRVVTLQNGRQKIAQIGQQLRLNQHCIDTAFNFFKMAVSKKLTRGRKNSHVTAACLYMVCRTEGTPHMLLDFSDVVQVNVYELGRTFLHLTTALCINIPPIDPCHHIIRFAHKLEFGDKTHEVSMTALRLVQRMKRDWIHTGRRPSGLCGAALLVAARLHDFSRTPKDIIKVVKVCEATLRKRLNEFGDTPSSHLTLDEFMSIDLEEEQDPPAFKAARKKAKLQQLEESGQLEKATQEITALQREIEKSLDEQKRLRGPYAKYAENPADDMTEDSMDQEESDVMQFVAEDTLEVIQDILEDDGTEKKKTPTDSHFNTTPLKTPVSTRVNHRGLGPTPESLGLKSSLEECMKVTEEPALPEEDGELDLTGLSDDELDYYIMSDVEVKRKTILWNQVNADYLKELKEKEEKDAQEKEEGLTKPEKKKRRVSKKRSQVPANTAGEAIEKMLQEKRISTKINYEVLRNLNNQPEDKESPSVESIPATSSIQNDIPLAKRLASSIFGSTKTEDNVEQPLGSTRTASLKSNRLPSILMANRGRERLNVENLASTKTEELEDTKKVSQDPNEVIEFVVETEPIQYENEEGDLDQVEEDDDEEGGLVSAVQLFGRTNDDVEYDEFADYEGDDS